MDSMTLLNHYRRLTDDKSLSCSVNAFNSSKVCFTKYKPARSYNLESGYPPDTSNTPLRPCSLLTLTACCYLRRTLGGRRGQRWLVSAEFARFRMCWMGRHAVQLAMLATAHLALHPPHSQFTPASTHLPTYDYSLATRPSVGGSFGTYGFILVVLVAVFEIARNVDFARMVFATRLGSLPNRTPDLTSKSRGFMKWVKPIMTMDDDEVRRMVGLDAFVMLRFVQICMKTTSWMLAGGIIILLPVYTLRVGEGHDEFGAWYVSPMKPHTVHRSRSDCSLPAALRLPTGMRTTISAFSRWATFATTHLVRGQPWSCSGSTTSSPCGFGTRNGTTSYSGAG
jgi:hypothetical protein